MSPLPATIPGIVSDGPSDIEVLWELHDGRRVWWPATATIVPKQLDCAQTEATILYEPKYGSPATKTEVVFLDDGLIRQKAGECEPQRHIDMSWRVRLQKYPRRIGRKQAPLQKMRQHQNRNRRTSQQKESTIEDVVEELKVLRKSNAKSQERIDILTRLVEVNNSVKEVSYISQGEQLMRLQVYLCQRLIQQVQKSPRIPNRKTRLHPHVNGCYDRERSILRSYIAASVDCDLDLFEQFARNCKTTHNDIEKGPLQYFPSFEMTQGASQGAKQFHILFPSLSAICDQLLLKSTSDRLEMVCKYACPRREGVLRILGSYSYDSDDDSNEVKLFPTHSCGDGRLDSGNGAEPFRKTFSLSRKSRVWKVEDRKYVYPLVLKRCAPSFVYMDGNTDQKELSLKSFHISWRRDLDATPRIWSGSIARPQVVLGKLEVTLPCVVLMGSALCDEFTYILDLTITTTLVT